MLIRLFWAERTNEETVGLLEDWPSGIGTKINDPTNATAYAFAMNGANEMSAIRPIPRPCPARAATPTSAWSSSRRFATAGSRSRRSRA